MTNQDMTRRVVDGGFAARTTKGVSAVVKASLRWGAALSVSAVASFGAATWLLLVNSHLPF